ncbi:hypothetical protein [uncultured Alistipes sp.]|jgi:lipoprotein|uniref:hypothetical protein n=1 Tax=uncultured Alistipes sp. TaxID=538949 RepID=UPI0025F96500|nr:hypothetical protein [uncultured Alistipes sp.]
MKAKILLIIALAMGLVFTSCSDDEKGTSVNKTYRMYVGQSGSAVVSTDAPATKALNDAASVMALQISNSLNDISVTGKGKNEEEALADAKRQAIAAYDLRAEQVIPQLIAIKTTFEANRTLSAAAILTETGYFTKITLQLFLVESTGDFQDPIIKQSDSYYMEAIGGQNYASAN